MESFSPVFLDLYDPLRAGSIDGTDKYPHDRAISRAMVEKYKSNKFVKGDPECTIFIARLAPNTTEETIRNSFIQFGKISCVRLVRDIVTGCSKCYAFVEFEDSYNARNAVRNGHKMIVDDREVLVEIEKERTLKGWIPRRLGGGLGGKRESGQLRFGGKDRPFRRPILRQNAEIDKFNKDNSVDRRRRASRSNSRERYRSRSKVQHRNRSKERHRSRSKERHRSRSKDRSRESYRRER